MEKHPTNEIMETLMSRVKEMVDVSTVIGDPIKTTDGVTLIPVSRVSFGFATGGADISTKDSKGDKPPFGAGSGAGVKINPVAFVVISDGHARVMNIEAPAVSTFERVLDSAPDIIDKVTGLFSKKDSKKAEAEAELVTPGAAEEKTEAETEE